MVDMHPIAAIRNCHTIRNGFPLQIPVLQLQAIGSKCMRSISEEADIILIFFYTQYRCPFVYKRPHTSGIIRMMMAECKVLYRFTRSNFPRFSDDHLAIFTVE